VTRLGGRAERWTVKIGVGIAIVALSVFSWWLLLNDRRMLLRVGIAMCVVAILVDVSLGARRRLRVRRQKRTAREDWPRATMMAIAREQGDRAARSADRED